MINYDIPRIPEDYVHRIGRTGRAGETGLAVCMVSGDEKVYLQAIENLLGQKIPVEPVEGYTVDSAVPDFVLLRPDDQVSEKRADKDIKKIVAKKAISEKRSKLRKAKSARRKPGSRSKSRSAQRSKPRSGKGAGQAKGGSSRSGSRNEAGGHKTSRTGSRSQQSSRQGRSKGGR